MHVELIVGANRPRIGETLLLLLRHIREARVFRAMFQSNPENFLVVTARAADAYDPAFVMPSGYAYVVALKALTAHSATIGSNQFFQKPFLTRR